MSGTAAADDDHRDVSVRLEANISGEADLALAIAVADTHTRDERLTVQLDGDDLLPSLVAAPHGGRVHLLRNVQPGRLVAEYCASVTGTANSAPPSELDWFEYVRPSRYCESDRLGPLARAEFGGLDPHELLAAVASWVGVNIAYVPGATRPIDGAVATLLGRAGVCRDFAHLTAALLRANGVAARTVSVYAPGLDPMDFHAVVEAAVGWSVVGRRSDLPRPPPVHGPHRDRRGRFGHGVPDERPRSHRSRRDRGDSHSIAGPTPRRRPHSRAPDLTTTWSPC